MPSLPSKTDPIIIVGAGIFGLSTAIHLAARGYTNVTVFDKQPYEKTLYSYAKGCDAASADSNKIIRSGYGSQTEYQALTTEALEAWNAWNAELKRGGAAVPPGMSSTDAVWINTGHLSCTDADTLPSFERNSIANMEAAGNHGTQLVNSNPDHLREATRRGIPPAVMNPFSKKVVGVLDTTGGIALADKACRFALHKAKSLGVRFVLDPAAGNLRSLLSDVSDPDPNPNPEPTAVVGIATADGRTHPAALTILACGGWTPALVPALDGLAETTAGSVVLLRIPASSALRRRFAPDVFSSWAFKMRDGAEGGLYGFPMTEDGVLKVGYRGTKYTNPRVQADGRERSVPVTRWSGGGGNDDYDDDGNRQRLKEIPEQALRVIRRFLGDYLPELKAEGIDVWLTRACWYTDSFDNHFVVDRVPGRKGLMVATGGSGHAFKYLPNIGKWVVDIVEGVGLDRPVVKAWRWRSLAEGKSPVNKLMEGSRGPRALGNVPLVAADAPKMKL